MGGGVSKMAKQAFVASIRDRCHQASKRDKGRILDELTTKTGNHRKHGIRLLSGTAGTGGRQVVGKRIYDEAVREAVIVVWDASDRICSKRFKAALPNLVDSMERHGHLTWTRRSGVGCSRPASPRWTGCSSQSRPPRDRQFPSSGDALR